MCNPAIANSALNLAAGAFNTAKEIKQIQIEKENAKYRSQIALNNSNEAKKQAQLINQQGIEEERKEKIKGLNKANQDRAKYAASGFLVDEGNNFMNIEDDINESFSNSKSIKDEYNLKTDSYINKANSYLNQSNSIIKNYNNSIYSKAINYLGSTNKVASKWYQDNTI